MVECSLLTMHAQLQSVAVVMAALRSLRATACPPPADACTEASRAHTPSEGVLPGSGSGQLNRNQVPVDGTAAGVLALEAVEELISHHVRAHCPDPADLHRLFPTLVEAAFGMPKQSVQQNAVSVGGSKQKEHNGRKSKGKRERERQAEDKEEQELQVNVEGVLEDPLENGGGGKMKSPGWNKQSAIGAAELLLKVRFFPKNNATATELPCTCHRHRQCTC